MRLVKLTNRNDRPIWVNPAQIVTLEPVAVFVDREHVGDQTLIAFALVGKSVEDEGTTHHEPYCERVTESPEQVAAALAEAVAPAAPMPPLNLAAFGAAR